VATAVLDGSRSARALEIARRQSEQLARLVDDLLDVARISQGRIVLRRSRVHLAEILERAVESSRAFIESRGLELSFSLPSGPTPVEADPGRLEQVFTNLLSNAAKYTEPGGRVEVTAERRAGEFVVRVRDNGIGISPELIPGIWDLFTQAERTPDRALGGLGIGLTVARRLTELHEGTIEARSEGPGKGSEFLVTLPAQPEAAAMDGERSAPATPGRASSGSARVLLIEDNPDAAESLAMLLELLGHRVRVSHDGITGIEAARAHGPDVILVDIGLPGMDGYEVARRLRLERELGHVVLVALTGYGRDQDKRQAAAAGFDSHLVKPATLDAIEALLASVTPSRR
jgi:CheY-like chemotaxis protein